MVCWAVKVHPPDVVGVMSTTQSKEVVFTCNQSITKMQLIAELFLLGNDLRPVTSFTVTGFSSSYPNCKELVMTRTKELFVIAGRIHELLYSTNPRWMDVNVCVQDMCDHVVALTESCAHTAYLLALTFPNCVPATPGIVDFYSAKRANIDLGMCSQHFKLASRDQLTPPMLVQICSNINQHLGKLTDSCRHASSRTNKLHDQEQFNFCVKSFTASASCLMSSIKCFKKQPTESHRLRCINFCDSLTSMVSSTVTFATEPQFIGRPAQITQEAMQSKIAILGACMSIVSSTIQLCKVVKELAYNVTNQVQRERLAMCIQAISHASSQLADAFLQHQLQGVNAINSLAYSSNHDSSDM